MATSDFKPEVEIRPFCACTMHPAIIIGTVRSLWTWLYGSYHVPQNVFLVNAKSPYVSVEQAVSVAHCYCLSVAVSTILLKVDSLE